MGSSLFSLLSSIFAVNSCCVVSEFSELKMVSRKGTSTHLSSDVSMICSIMVACWLSSCGVGDGFVRGGAFLGLVMDFPCWVGGFGGIGVMWFLVLYSVMPSSTCWVVHSSQRLISSLSSGS